MSGSGHLVVKVPEEVDPLRIFGVNPLSPFADLFVNIYNVTKPSSEWMKKMGSDLRSRSPPSSGYCCGEDLKKEADINFDDFDIDIKKERRSKEGSVGYVQCCNRWFKEGTALNMHQNSQSHLKNRLEIEEQLVIDPCPVRIEWLRGLLGE